MPARTLESADLIQRVERHLAHDRIELTGAPIGPVASACDGTVRARLRGNLPYGPAIAVGGLSVALALALT